MRVTFDSNAWEDIFHLDQIRGSAIRIALEEGRIAGFICAAGFRIEAITKKTRSSYFAQPHMDVSVEIVHSNFPKHFSLAMSIGPDDRKHPGLPAVQVDKLNRALTTGIKLMHGQNWMGLPTPVEIRDPSLYVPETREEASIREGRQILVSSTIDARGVGNAAFIAADGWTDRPRTPAEEKELIRACAEWADGEVVAAHVAYGNDILCTDDCALAAGHSIFDAPNRAWLAANYGVSFMTVDELTTSAIL